MMGSAGYILMAVLKAARSMVRISEACQLGDTRIDDKIWEVTQGLDSNGKDPGGGFRTPSPEP
jgi:hypothetical protein